MDTKSLKELFDKYMVVWIWSIFVSINTALSYNIFNLYSEGRWGKLIIFLIPLYLLAAGMALASWVSLFNFFKIKILTLILNLGNDSPPENDSDVDRKKTWFAYRQLKNSFYFIIFAIFFRFLISIVEMAFNQFYR